MLMKVILVMKNRESQMLNALFVNKRKRKLLVHVQKLVLSVKRLNVRLRLHVS
jgi:hypothetical protein